MVNFGSFIKFLIYQTGFWIIDPPYGLGKEEWDNIAWNTTHFDQIFKKILAIDNRKNIYVICFGTIEILADFSKICKVFIENNSSYSSFNF